jgi:crotonobetainyl-CoA:carnitine CoA-transferase CaiB-like acyl-CoA transferase
MLADMGAEVIKVEEPTGGDFGRRMWREPDGFTAFFEALDRGKQSVCIDLATRVGRNWRSRSSHLRRGRRELPAGHHGCVGAGYEAFRARNRRVVYAQATGWGTRGPLAAYPSFDQIAQAYSGYAQHSGGGPGQRPEVPYPGVADQSGAMNLAFGITTALFVRERTGIGQKVECSLLGTQIALQAPEILHTLHFGREHDREFRASPTVGHFECADNRWVMVVGIDQKFWPRLTRALGLDHLTDDERFARGFARYQNRATLEPILEEVFRANTSSHWLARLRECDVPAAVVQDYAELAEDEQALANEYIVEQEHPRFGRQKVVGLHVQLSETPGKVGDPAPELGAHTSRRCARSEFPRLGCESSRKPA